MKKVLLLALLVGFNAAAKNPYPSAGTCDGLPKVNLTTPSGTCVGVVSSDLKVPRGVLPVSDDEIFVTEMGSWEKNAGRLSKLTKTNHHFVRSTLIDKLDRPHGIAQGSGGWIAVAEAGTVFEFDPTQTNAPKKILAQLPNTGIHPLKQIVFDRDGNLYLSMGAETDHCEHGNQAQFPCQESLGKRATASIWQLKSNVLAVWARGLRNAMGMVISPKGELIVTENGRDNITQNNKKLNEAQLPHDELNIIKQDADYGWPYCYDNNRVNPEYRNHRNACQNKIAPSTLLPAHSAPLGIILYPDNGEIVSLRGYYLIALHGYRDTGHEVVKIKAGADGRPTGAISTVIGGWERTDNQPMGAPVEMRVSPSGKVYITDDRNDVLLRLANIR